MSQDQGIELFRRFLVQQKELGVSELVFEKKRDESFILEEILNNTQNCRNCPLSGSRIRYVFGEGNSNAELMFIGEAPGEEEDKQGRPFVGAAGGLLTKMIEAIGLKREQTFIANILKCRPPNNRDPLPEETSACLPILESQIKAIKPRFICALGRIAAQTLLQTTQTLGQLRGRIYDWKGIKLIVTYHPAALLRNAQWKRPAWEDLQMLMKEMRIHRG